VLEELAHLTGLPQVLVMDNGPEFTSKAMLCWAEQRGVKLHFIDPDKPAQNAYIESFNGKFRDECLNQAGSGTAGGSKDDRGLAERLQPDPTPQFPGLPGS
jgi:transposase InsO family protein